MDNLPRRVKGLTMLSNGHVGTNFPCRIVLGVSLLTALMSAVLVACGTTNSGGARRSAPAASSTPASMSQQPQLVTVAVTVAQQGTVVQQNVKLLATVTITNHANVLVGITDPTCNSPYPPVLIEVDDSAGRPVWQTHLWDGSCPLVPPRDLLSLLPGASQIWTITNDLSRASVEVGISPPGPPMLAPGATYTVKATLLQWHEGSVDDLGKSGVIQGQDVIGETTIVLR